MEKSIEEIKFHEPDLENAGRTNVSAFTKKKILIVDDQSFNINAVTQILKSHFNVDPNIYCDVSYNGEDALNKVISQVELTGKNPYKLILMD